MFRACFVARIDPADKAVQLFNQYRHPELGSSTTLPSVQNLGQFCFPLGPDKVAQREYASPQEHSYTLTGGDGSHLHGFCRTFLPPRTNEVDARGRSLTLRFPQVLCLISPLPWLPFYAKVLRIVEQFLREQGLLNKVDCSDLPAGSHAALFLDSLLKECKAKPQLGRVITVSVPTRSSVCISPQHRIQGIEDGPRRSLKSTKDFVELQIPPDTGNGSWNAGIPLARLLWHLPPDALLALIQALLLEKRILMLSEDRNALTANLHAAAALLYPFRWQHIYLPILPHSLLDYLSAPMPYLIGLPFPKGFKGLSSIELEDVVCVDLDNGTCCSGGIQGKQLDYALLPWSHHLKDAIQSKVYPRISGPHDVVNTPIIGLCMQEYFLKLLGTYREFIEVDEPDAETEPADEDAVSNVRRTHQDDGYIRLNGYRFDHLSFVENQRRSEKAKEFLKMMRHSQMYDVFVNERLALAAGGYQSKDAFESRVAYLAAKKGNVTRRVAQVGVKGVSNIAGMLQRTSTFVKSGVSQIRHSQTFGEALDVVRPNHHPPAEPIVPSYSINLDAQARSPAPSAESSPRKSSEKEEKGTTFFNHDPNAEDDRPPEAAAEPERERELSPLRQRFSGPSSPPGSAHAFATLSSPRAAEPESFEALLNLDGVDGVFLPTASYSQPSPADGTGSLDNRASLLDDPGGAPATDLSSWGLGMPAAADLSQLRDEISEAAAAAADTVSSTVSEWASKVSNLAITLTTNEEATTPEPTPSSLRVPSQFSGRAPSYDLSNSMSLGTIDAFQEFKSPEALRASSLTKPLTPQARSESPLRVQIPAHLLSPGLESTPAGHVEPKDLQSSVSFRNSATSHTPLTREPSSVRSSQLSQSVERSSKDPFSAIDPIVKGDLSQPMSAYKSSSS